MAAWLWAKIINMATIFSHAHILYIYILMWNLKGKASNGLKGIASSGLYNNLHRYDTWTFVDTFFHMIIPDWPGPPMTWNKLMWFQPTNKSNIKCPNTLHCLDQYTAPMPKKHVQRVETAKLSGPWSGLGRWSSLIMYQLWWLCINLLWWTNR